MKRYEVAVNGNVHEVTLIAKSGSTVTFSLAGETYCVDVRPVLSLPVNQSGAIAFTSPTPVKSRTTAASGDIVAPMPGIIVHVPVAVGAEVTPGQTVVVVEAMKMENNIPAATAGKVKKIHVAPGAEVEGGQVLITIG